MEVDRSSVERALGATPLFSRLNPTQLREIVGVGQRVTLEAGSLVVREGDDADRVYVILEGKVRVFRRDPSGNNVEISELQNGNIFGEYAILDGGVRSASVATVTGCELFALDRVSFLNLLGSSPDVVGHLISSLTATIRTSIDRALSQMVAGVAHELNTPLGVAQHLEILPVALCQAKLVWLKPSHAVSLRVGLPHSAKPGNFVLDVIGWYPLVPRVVHSTSWRYEEGQVVLTYIVVVDPPANLPPGSLEAIAIERAELARGQALAPPDSIGVAAVLDHALRHLSWLVRDDPAIAAALADWSAVLGDYQPEPFRALA